MCMYKLAAGEVIAGGWQHGQHPSALAEMDALLCLGHPFGKLAGVTLGRAAHINLSGRGSAAFIVVGWREQ